MGIIAEQNIAQGDNNTFSCISAYSVKLAGIQIQALNSHVSQKQLKISV